MVNIGMKTNVSYIVAVIAFFVGTYLIFMLTDPIINGLHDYGVLAEQSVEIHARLDIFDKKNASIDANTRLFIEKYNAKILNFRAMQKKTPSFWQKDWYSLPVFVLNSQKTRVIWVDYKGKIGSKFSSL